MEEKLLHLVKSFNGYLTDNILIILLIGAGIYFTVRTRFVQVRCFGEGCRRVFGDMLLKGKKRKSGLSSFQALATAVAAQVGTGNIVGACDAILVGGPGAIFWMWVFAFFGMSTIYAEAVLAQKTREVDADGSVRGGPVYYIRSKFKGGFGKFLTVFFAVAAVLALGFFGSMVQSNSIGEAVNNAFGIPTWVSGLVVAVLAAVIFIGGIQRIGSVTEKLVPFMALLYLVGGFIIIASRIQYIPETFALIFKCAFNPQAIIGGSFGAAIRTAISKGANRGLFSNEAGMGSTPHAHALANVDHPHDQGVSAMMGVFIDTFVVINITAFVVISSLYTGGGPLSEVGVGASAAGIVKTNMAQMSFSSLFGSGFGNAFVAVCLLFFAFSTIVSWNLFGRINFEYLFGKKRTIIYSAISVCFIFVGSILSNDLVWQLTDTFNYLMVLPNVIAIVSLGGVVAKESKDARARKKAAKK